MIDKDTHYTDNVEVNKGFEAESGYAAIVIDLEIKKETGKRWEFIIQIKHVDGYYYINGNKNYFSTSDYTAIASYDEINHGMIEVSGVEIDTESKKITVKF